MNIGLNLLHARPRIGGVWNYISNIVGTLGMFDDKNQYFCYCTPASECLVPPQVNFKKVIISPSWVRNQLGRVLFENTFLQIMGMRDHLDLIHWFGNTRALLSPTKSVVTIYDLGVFELKLDTISSMYLSTMLPFAARHATVIAPMSQTTEDALVRRFAIDRGRSVVVPTPIPPFYAPSNQDAVKSFRRAYSLPERFWLYVAHCYPHKNHYKLFEAYRIYRSHVAAPWPIVLRGEKYGNDVLIEDFIRREGILENVIWLPRLQQEEMPVLYSAAAALIFPSIYEGGGIPVMEAMACGCPVTASDIPTTREFAGDAAYLFDPNHAVDIAAKMVVFAGDAALREGYRARGFKQAALLSRAAVFSRIMQSYQKAMTEAHIT